MEKYYNDFDVHDFCRILKFPVLFSCMFRKEKSEVNFQTL